MYEIIAETFGIFTPFIFVMLVCSVIFNEVYRAFKGRF